MNKIELPRSVSFIISSLNDAGYEAYIVGGCVRDYLLGKQPKDWDITTSALPEDVKRVFAHTYDTGIEHGTVTVLIDKVGYEVTTYRIDGEYKDNRHPESVIFTNKLTGDLARRDFTMNAIAYNDSEGFVDMFNGMEDLRMGIIRAVREPSERFREDALRMMRALRFSAQLGFEIEENTKRAICENASLIKNISMERIRDELIKLILSDNPLNIYEVKAEGLMDCFMPELSSTLENQRNEITACLEMTAADTVKRLSLLMHSLPATEQEKLLRRLRLDNRTVKDVITLSRCMNVKPNPTPYEIRKLISETSVSMTDDVIYMWSVLGYKEESTAAHRIFERITADGDCCSVAQLAISGEDLIKEGIPAGKQLGDILRASLDEVLRQPEHNSREYLIDKAVKMMGGK